MSDYFKIKTNPLSDEPIKYTIDRDYLNKSKAEYEKNRDTNDTKKGGIILKISRQAEDEFPEFDSHEKARKYFKDKYGDSFILTSSEMIGDDKVFFYHLILDRQEYLKGRKKLEEDGFIMDSLDFINSHQPVEIFEDGRIHVIH